MNAVASASPRTLASTSGGDGEEVASPRAQVSLTRLYALRAG